MTRILWMSSDEGQDYPVVEATVSPVAEPQGKARDLIEVDIADWQGREAHGVAGPRDGGEWTDPGAGEIRLARIGWLNRLRGNASSTWSNGYVEARPTSNGCSSQGTA